MEIILLEKITNLGDLGDSVIVRPGYARNYLIPQRKAVLATPEAIEEVNRRRVELAKEEKERLDVAKARAEVAVKELEFVRNTIDDEGRLFGSVSVKDIVDAAQEAGTEISRSEIDILEGAIKTTGIHRVQVRTHPEVTYEIEVTVKSSEETPSEELVQVVSEESTVAETDSEDSLETQSETQSETQLETQSETQLETQLETQSETEEPRSE